MDVVTGSLYGTARERTVRREAHVLDLDPPAVPAQEWGAPVYDGTAHPPSCSGVSTSTVDLTSCKGGLLVKMRAEGTCTIAGWDEETLWTLQGRSKLAQASITQTYAGDLVGSSRWEALLCHGEDGTIRCAGLARLVGRLGGRTGTFSMEVRGVCEDAAVRVIWRIVPGSGTGELRGLSGEGTCTLQRHACGVFTLDYELT
jgi:hypothetical protein